MKIALYFAWLGFYTHMLIPASIVGIFTFLYGLVTLFSNTVRYTYSLHHSINFLTKKKPFSIFSEDICNPKNDIIMCPQCDEQCDYWYLRSTCIYSRISYLFDNNMTVMFACFMSFWGSFTAFRFSFKCVTNNLLLSLAVLYLELWKRYSAKLIHRWGLADFSHQVSQNIVVVYQQKGSLPIWRFITISIVSKVGKVWSSQIT